MVYQKTYAVRVLAVLMAFLLAFGAPMTVFAETSHNGGIWNADESTVAKLMDMALRKIGVVLDDASRSKYVQYFAGKLLGKTYETLADAIPDLCNYLFGVEHGGGGLYRDDGTKVSVGDPIQSGDNYYIDNSVVNNVYNYFQDYMNEYSPYILVPTMSLADVPVSWFLTKTAYNNFAATVNMNRDKVLQFVFPDISWDNPNYGVNDSSNYFVSNLTDSYLVYRGGLPSPKNVYCDFYSSNWIYKSFPFLDWGSGYFNLSNIYDFSGIISTRYSYDYLSYEVCKYVHFNYASLSTGSTRNGLGFIVSSDRRPLKVFRTVSDMKNYTLNRQPFYYSNIYYNYDVSVDNFVTINGGYYNTYDEGDYYNVVQNIVNNSVTENPGITEDDLQNIIQKVIDELEKPDTPVVPDNPDLPPDISGGDSGKDDVGKNIFDKISDFFGGFFDNLGKSLLNLIVPTSDQLTSFLTEVNDWFSDRLGFIWYPFDLAIGLVESFALGDAQQQFSVPALTLNILGNQYTLWNDLEVDLDAFGIFQYVRYFTSALLVCGVVRMAVNKWDEWIGGHGVG